MNLTLSADWHGDLPDCGAGDVLIVAGDVMPLTDHSQMYQQLWFERKLLPHLAAQDFKRVLWVAGNHDFWLQHHDPDEFASADHVHYLQDEPYVFEGVRFYGTPWSNTFGRWAFMADDDVLGYVWDDIPSDTDVLIVHGPPHMAGDQVQEGAHVGSHTLREWIEENAPQIVVTGHIHEDYGSHPVGLSTVYNVSLMTRNYHPLNPLVEIEI